jgi:hypothetical protein
MPRAVVGAHCCSNFRSAGVNLPDDLINLERTAEEARARMAGLTGAEYDAQWRAWREASAAVQAAITKHADRDGQEPDDASRWR